MEQKQKDNGTGATEPPCEKVNCDRYPGQCPLVESVKRIRIKVEGGVGNSCDFVDSPEKIWDAVTELERDFEKLSDRVSEVSSQVLRDKKVTTISFTERTWRSPFILVIFILIILFFVWLALFPDRQYDLNQSRGEINRVQTTTGE